jgi:spore maturation protein CgeB
MRIVYFTHSLVSCWNHGNAHFLRGLLRELIALGHEVRAYEPEDGWSRAHIAKEPAIAFEAHFKRVFPELDIVGTYQADVDVARLVDGADLVIAHEWIAPRILHDLGELKRKGGRFTLLFHDTHHRAVSEPGWLRGIDRGDYDGVLAFGQSLADAYRRAGWGARVFVFHEAADIRLFQPPPEDDNTSRRGAVWIGNWGDGERSEEISSFLVRPARRAGIPLDVYGVRYPPEALQVLEANGATYRGWIANADVPRVFAKRFFTVHVPRRYYTRLLPGIPTIRVFEALACGIPLISSAWDDCENLFRPGEDFLMAGSEDEMTRAMAAVRADADLRASLAQSGLETIRARHTCAHRAAELLAIARQVTPQLEGAA